MHRHIILAFMLVFSATCICDCYDLRELLNLPEEGESLELRR